MCGIEKLLKKYDIQAMNKDNFKKELLDLFIVSGRFSELDMRESFKAGAIYERSCEYYSKRPKITMAGHLVSNPTPDFSEFIYHYNDR